MNPWWNCVTRELSVSLTSPRLRLFLKVWLQDKDETDKLFISFTKMICSFQNCKEMFSLADHYLEKNAVVDAPLSWTMWHSHCDIVSILGWVWCTSFKLWMCNWAHGTCSILFECLVEKQHNSSSNVGSKWLWLRHFMGNLSYGLKEVVQAFYRQKWVNLPLIAKQCFLTDFSPGTCPL